jgi:hypothetical protein
LLGAAVRHMNWSDFVANKLAPHLGMTSADAVARHLCARHGIGEEPPDPAAIAALQETLRRGLVRFVGQERADEIARSLSSRARSCDSAAHDRYD